MVGRDRNFLKVIMLGADARTRTARTVGVLRHGSGSDTWDETSVRQLSLICHLSYASQFHNNLTTIMLSMALETSSLGI